MFFGLRTGWTLAPSLRLRRPLLRRASTAAGSRSSSFILSYLVSSCGISPELAPTVAKKATFHSPEKADAVLLFLRSRGFSEAQVAECVRKDPNILCRNGEVALRPKFEALEGIGFSKPGIAELLCKEPKILDLSENKGTFSKVVALLRTLVPNEADCVRLLNRSPWILGYISLNRISPNVDLLLKEGVPIKNLSSAFLWKPRMFATDTPRFLELVQSVKDMGFRPSTVDFIVAIQAMTVRKKWDHNLKVYNSLGLTDDQILSAFKMHPTILLLSEKKIRKMMGYFVGVQGFSPDFVLKYPQLLKLSLEKRIIPRYKVLEMLAEKGIVCSLRPYSFLMLTEKVFLDRYVNKHKEKVPELLNSYSASAIQ